jgi:hypothetical protein
MGNNEIPRRSRLDLVTPEEKALYEMVWQIEKLGAHVLLTDVVVLLGRAREKLADWVELNAAQQTLDGATVAVKEVICPICSSIVSLYDGNKIGMHTPHNNVSESICKSSGVEITPRR